METDTLTQTAHKVVLENEWTKINWHEWIVEPSNLLGFFLLLTMVAIGYLWYKKKIKISHTSVIRAVGLVFFCGWIIYTIGFFSEGTKHSLIALLIRPALSSLEMFVSHSDLLEVHEYWKENPFYMTFFAIIHFSAILLSGIVIIHYLGVRYASKIRLWGLNKRKKGIKDLYIFWNVDENSIHLAEDIHKNSETDKVIVFVESQEEEDKTKNRLSFSHFFSHFSFSRELLDKINSLDGILIRGKYILNNGIANDNDTLRKLGLSRLIRKSENVYFFLLSENENLNILSALNLKNDLCVKEKRGQKKEDNKLQIFCHAFKDSANRVFESESTPSIEIKVVDSSYLSVVSLKSACKRSSKSEGLWRQYAYHPVNYITVDKKMGVATSCFSSLIVGFGETGQEALRFLFEFGQFPYAENREKACNFKCSVCDVAMDTLKGRFFMKTPAFEKPETGITYHSIDYTSSGFWQHLHSRLDELNYIVIAVGDDEKGISLAVDIYEFAERSGKNISEKFSIFVRSYKRTNEKLLCKIAEKYKDTIVIFGASSDIFVKKLVIDEELLQMAQKFYYEYSRQAADAKDLKRLENKSPEALWNERRKNERGKEVTVTDRMKYQDVIRKEGQDISNCMHIYTKVQLVGGVDALPSLEPYREIFNLKEPQEIKKQYQKSIFLENLAKGEHKRWNAAHYAMGYIRMLKEEQVGNASCCEVRKKHLCLVPWEELPSVSTTDYQTYDRTVVQTSFYFAMRNL